jgi:hypothetical protein
MCFKRTVAIDLRAVNIRTVVNFTMLLELSRNLRSEIDHEGEEVGKQQLVSKKSTKCVVDAYKEMKQIDQTTLGTLLT